MTVADPEPIPGEGHGQVTVADPEPTPGEPPVLTPHEQEVSEGVQSECKGVGADKICFTTPSCLMHPPKITCKTLITVYKKDRVFINELHKSIYLLIPVVGF